MCGILPRVLKRCQSVAERLKFRLSPFATEAQRLIVSDTTSMRWKELKASGADGVEDGCELAIFYSVWCCMPTEGDLASLPTIPVPPACYREMGGTFQSYMVEMAKITFTK